MTPDDRKQAERLAIDYCAYVSAMLNDPRDHAGVIVWGSMLLASQDRIGSKLADPEGVFSNIKHSQSVLDARDLCAVLS